MRTQCRISIMIAVMAALSCGVNANTLPASQDNYVYQSQPNTPALSGTGAVFQVKAQSGYSRKAYLDFDISALSEPVTDAALNIRYWSPISPGTAMQEFSVYGLTGGQTWNESTLTWNNAPGNEAKETSGLINTSNTVLLADFTVVAGSQYTVAVSSSNIVNYLNWAAGNSGDFYGTGVTKVSSPTFVITAKYGTPDGIGAQFVSSEFPTKAYRPSLTVK